VVESKNTRNWSLSRCVGVEGFQIIIDFALAGNWVYTYADFGGCGDTRPTSGSGGKIVQDGAFNLLLDELVRVLQMC
jgi:hypothetical protein